jgi:MFS superfamily sulfate permease-like transporter
MPRKKLEDLEVSTKTERSATKTTTQATVKAPDQGVTNMSNNKFKSVIYLAQAVDAWRIFPRVFITVYIILLYQVTHWFMALPDPNMNQAGLVSIVVGAGAAWFGLYLGSSKKFKDD